MKSILVVLALAFGVALTSQAQYTYHNNGLVASNLVINGGTAATPSTVSNLVAANFAFSATGSAGNIGNGIFEVKPSGQDSYYSTQGGVCFQLAYTQTNTVAAAATGLLFTNNAIIQPLLDDFTIGPSGGGLGSYASLSNSAAFLVPFVIVSNSVNGVYLATVQVPATNMAGCRYGKLLGFSGNGTNQLIIKHLRAGYWDVQNPAQ